MSKINVENLLSLVLLLVALSLAVTDHLRLNRISGQSKIAEHAYTEENTNWEQETLKLKLAQVEMLLESALVNTTDEETEIISPTTY